MRGRPYSLQLSGAQIAALEQEIRRADFLSLKERYSQEDSSDFDSTCLRAEMASGTREVHVYSRGYWSPDKIEDVRRFHRVLAKLLDGVPSPNVWQTSARYLD